MQIDLFTLSIGKIVYKDYTIGTEPGVRVYDVNRHKSYKNISTVQQLALLMLAEPMNIFVEKKAEILGVPMREGFCTRYLINCKKYNQFFPTCDL
jgi:hypothetical protein